LSPAVLVVVATAAEAESLGGLPGARVVVSGIGAVNAGLATLQAGLEEEPSLIVSAGIGGAMPGRGVEIGDVVVASQAVAASLGAEDGKGFLDLREMGFPLWEMGTIQFFDRIPTWAGSANLAGAAGARFGPILTVDTVTGTQTSLERLASRYPDALAEAMEGSGVAQAALRLGVPFVEVRGISNLVGPRDRGSWRIGAALHALAAALSVGWPVLEAWHADGAARGA
jgi:futalosine hydrolase